MDPYDRLGQLEVLGTAMADFSLIEVPVSQRST